MKKHFLLALFLVTTLLYSFATNKVQKVTYRYYTVEKGDNIYSIARKLEVKPKELMKVNNIADNSHKLKVGQKVKIPVTNAINAHKIKIQPKEENKSTKAESVPNDSTQESLNSIAEQAADVVQEATMPTLHSRKDSLQYQLANCNRQLDSLVTNTGAENVEENDTQAVLRKMEKARKRAKVEEPLKKMRDSLKVLLDTLLQNEQPIIVPEKEVAALDKSVTKEEVKTTPIEPLKEEKTAEIKPVEKAPVQEKLEAVPTPKDLISELKKQAEADKEPIPTAAKAKPKYLIPVDSTRQIKAEFYLNRATAAIDKKDYAQADKFLLKSLDINPNYLTAWMLHADLNASFGYLDKALKDYEICTQIDTANAKTFYNMAHLYMQMGSREKSYQYLTKAIAVDPDYILAILGRAAILIEKKDFDGAIKDYDRVISLNKFFSFAYKGRGTAKVENKDYNGAINDFNEYLELDKPEGYVYYERGIAKIRLNKLLEGCNDLATALEMGYKEAEKAIKKNCE